MDRPAAAIACEGIGKTLATIETSAASSFTSKYLKQRKNSK
jgi:hypothetical protein